MKHIVSKQRLDLVVSNRLDAFNVQHRMSRLYQEELLPAMEQLFDRLSEEETMISIDRLEIDLGVITEREFMDNRAVDRLVASLQEQLTTAIEYRHAQASSTKPLKRAITYSVLLQWLFYLQRGYLPWNATKAGPDWPAKILEALAADHHSVAALRTAMVKQPTVVQRLVWQYPAPFLVTLAGVLTATRQDELPLYLVEIQQAVALLQEKGYVAALPVQPRLLGQSCWQSVFTLLSVQHTAMTPAEICSELIASVATGAEVAVMAGEAEMAASLPRTFPLWQALAASIPKDAIQRRAPNTRPNQTMTDEQAHMAHKTPPPTNEQVEAVEGALPEANINTPRQDKAPEAHREQAPLREPDEDGIYVQHAGLVLLYPFLHRFFRNLGLAGEKSFVTVDEMTRAIYLLHNLATGNRVAQEYELVMPKLLCGCPVGSPVDPHIEWLDTEVTEADELADEVIGQWDKLKGTSVNGLRESFLQRQGKLVRRGGRLWLQVESSTIDVLLDYLPWNISIIKLPWMKEMLQVDWR